MRASGGRRVERSVFIDVNSVRFCSDTELAGLERLGWLDGLTVGEEPVKEVGEYTATIRLHKEVTAQVAFEVVAE